MTHICVRPSLVKKMTCRPFSAMPLSEPSLDYCCLDAWEQISIKYVSKYNNFHIRKRVLKYRLHTNDHFVSDSMCKSWLHKRTKVLNRLLKIHFADDIFKCILWNENFSVLIEKSAVFVPNDQINDKSALVQLMAWHRTGDKPFSELN